MTVKIKSIVKSIIPLYHFIIRKKEIIPPLPSVKQRIVKKYAKNFSIRILIETGTYLGDMVEATRNVFDKIYSIELDKNLYNRAKKKFSKSSHITIIKGDSSKNISLVIEKISEPCLFWLDAHYSGGITARGDKETPIMQELDHIFNHHVRNHVVLIDDARLFVGKKDYPSLRKLKKFVLKKHPALVFKVKDDIIRIHKRIAEDEKS